jgi:hypothetical protein
MTEPIYKGGAIYTEDFARTLYHLETVDEGQPWPPNDPGGSGLEICKIAQQEGLIKGYHHAFGLQHSLEALTIQPVLFGINWYDSFFNPLPTGEVKLTRFAQVAGGHEIVGVGIDTVARQVWFMNSWGTSWGHNGTFSMSFNLLNTLLNQQGDCTVPIV